MSSFHEGGSEAYQEALVEEYSAKINELGKQLERADVVERESLKRRKLELEQELATKLADAQRMMY